MNELLLQAEKEMLEMKQPYVTSAHIFLAYLKNNKNEYIDYICLKDIIIKVMGSCYKKSDYKIYTTLTRKYIKECNNDIYLLIKKLLSDDNTIVYNLLINAGVDIEKIINNI